MKKQEFLQSAAAAALVAVTLWLSILGGWASGLMVLGLLEAVLWGLPLRGTKREVVQGLGVALAVVVIVGLAVLHPLSLNISCPPCPTPTTLPSD